MPAPRSSLKISGLMAALISASMVSAVSAEAVSNAKTQKYRVAVLPVDGGPDSYLAGYLFYAPLTPTDTVGVVGDNAANPAAYDPYTWTNGLKTDLQILPSIPGWVSSGAYINWINQWGLAAGFATRIDPTTKLLVDNAVVWTPDGTRIDIQESTETSSHAVWINDLGQVSGWTASTTPDSCSFGTSLARTQAVVWEFGVLRKLGTLGGADSYGEFINDLGQISGHAQTSNTPNADTGCPPFDPFIWQNGKMTDINPGNFGGAEGGTNFLDNGGQAVGFGTLKGDAEAHAFLWEHGKLQDLTKLGSLGGMTNSGFNVNDLSHVVGISYTADNAAVHAVLWEGTKFTDLKTLSGDDCSEPYRINDKDQIVGVSFSCETGVEHAFLWDNGRMVDLNTLIPADSGLELQYGSWINDAGVIAAQAVLTSGPAAGTSRAVLLIPDGDASDAALGAPAGRSPKARVAAMLVRGSSATQTALHTAEGRPNPALFKPFSPNTLFGGQKSAN